MWVETVELIIGAALAVLSVFILVYPFLKPRLRAESEDGEAGADPVSGELAPIYDAINTLHLEYQLGKVPEPLYREQLSGYRVQAAGVLRRQAQEQTDEEAGDTPLPPGLEGRPAPAESPADGGQALRCPSCGAAVDPGSAACSGCGVAPDAGA